MAYCFLKNGYKCGNMKILGIKQCWARGVEQRLYILLVGASHLQVRDLSQYDRTEVTTQSFCEEESVGITIKNKSRNVDTKTIQTICKKVVPGLQHFRV